jgi:hypothetical protein
MFRTNRPRFAWWVRETLVVVAALLLGLLFVTRVDADDRPVSRKMARQIDVMEKIIDQVLVDSPNFLVQGRENARGLYLEEFGVLFTFDASLVHGGSENISNMLRKWDQGFRIKEEEDGTRTIVIPDFTWGDDDEDEDRDADVDEDEDAELDDEDRSDPERALRSWREREYQRGERLYKRGKTEIVDVLLDYGDTMTSLPNGNWVAIVAFLRDNRYFERERISKLVLKAKIEDLRAFTSEKISEEEMFKRIVEQEY